MRWWTLKSDKWTVHMHNYFRANALFHWTWKAGIHAQDLAEIYRSGPWKSQYISIQHGWRIVIIGKAHQPPTQDHTKYPAKVESFMHPHLHPDARPPHVRICPSASLFHFCFDSACF